MSLAEQVFASVSRELIGNLFTKFIKMHRKNGGKKQLASLKIMVSPVLVHGMGFTSMFVQN